MKAMVQGTYGSADVLELRDIDKPVVGDGDVLVRVLAAGIDQGAWHLMTGEPYLMRLVTGLRAPKAHTLKTGGDIAGRVETVGPKVTRFHPGAEVFGICEGSFAEYAITREDKITVKPTNLSLEQAATVPTSGCTALQGLRNVGNLQAGQQVLIIGAAGGVGTFTVQLAKAYGAEVTGVCSTTKVELVRSIGADAVIDYTRDDFVKAGLRYDLILDIAGNRSLSHLRGALARKGTLVIVGGEGGGKWFGGIDRQLRAAVLSVFVGQKLGTFIAKPNSDDLVVLKELIEAGKVTPVIDKRYSLSDVPEAIGYLRQGHARGKLVITV